MNVLIDQIEANIEGGIGKARQAIISKLKQGQHVLHPFAQCDF